MKSKTEFIERWKLQMVGLAMYGVTSERNDGLMSRSARILELPKEVQGLLGAMYDSLDPENYPCVSAGKFDGTFGRRRDGVPRKAQPAPDGLTVHIDDSARIGRPHPADPGPVPVLAQGAE